MRKYGVIIAARTGSTRLPGKALLPINDLPMIVFLIRRILNTRLAEKIVFATTCLPEDDELCAVVRREGIPIFRGADEDVVERYVMAADAFDISFVVRITGDCPFVDSETLGYCLDQCNRMQRFDLATTKTLFPVGIDYEIYDASLLKRLHSGKLLDRSHREHVTKYFYDYLDRFIVNKIKPKKVWKHKDAVFTVDTHRDYVFAQALSARFESIHFSVDALIKAAAEIQADKR